MQVRFAASLRAPDDELRDTLLSMNNRWPVAEVLSAAQHLGVLSGGYGAEDHQPGWKAGYPRVAGKTLGLVRNRWSWACCVLRWWLGSRSTFRRFE